MELRGIQRRGLTEMQQQQTQTRNNINRGIKNFLFLFLYYPYLKMSLIFRDSKLEQLQEEVDAISGVQTDIV